MASHSSRPASNLNICSREQLKYRWNISTFSVLCYVFASNVNSRIPDIPLYPTSSYDMLFTVLYSVSALFVITCQNNHWKRRKTDELSNLAPAALTFSYKKQKNACMESEIFRSWILVESDLFGTPTTHQSV